MVLGLLLPVKDQRLLRATLAQRQPRPPVQPVDLPQLGKLVPGPDETGIQTVVQRQARTRPIEIDQAINPPGISNLSQPRDNQNMGRLNVLTTDGPRVDGSCYEAIYALGGARYRPEPPSLRICAPRWGKNRRPRSRWRERGFLTPQPRDGFIRRQAAGS